MLYDIEGFTPYDLSLEALWVLDGRAHSLLRGRAHPLESSIRIVLSDLLVNILLLALDPSSRVGATVLVMHDGALARRRLLL